MTRRVLLALLAAGVVAPLVCSGPAAQGAATAARPYDFDGDGYPELAASAPGLLVDDPTNYDAGGVVVLPASRDGLSLEARLITKSTSGSGDQPVEGDRFGDGLASADFDRDGYADLVVATRTYIGHGQGIGVLTVIPGSQHGLDPAGTVELGYPGPSVEDDPTGLTDVLVAADLTGDGYPDLAAGVPSADYEPIPDEAAASGEVVVFAGGSGGLTDDSAQTLRHQGPGGGHQDWDSGFGSSLGAGDLDGDGTIDLVVGSRGGNETSGSYPGSVSVCPGSARGPTTCTRLAHSLDLAGPTSFAIGAMTGAARPDLVVALPAPTKDAAGSLRILQLKPTGGIEVAKTLVLTQASRGVPGVDEPKDAFGGSLGLADLDSDGHADLVVGAPGENSNRGRLTVVHGASGGWRTGGNRTYSQDTKGVPGKAEADDRFGSSFTLLDHDGDGRLDLDVGAPGENGSGSVTILSGRGKGFTTKGSKAFSLTTLGIATPEDADFGVPMGS